MEQQALQHVEFRECLEFSVSYFYFYPNTCLSEVQAISWTAKGIR